MTGSVPDPSTAPPSEAGGVEPPSGHVPALDGARAVATVAVFLFHSLWRTPALDPFHPVLAHADLGVEVFFILSGFLVARPLVAHAVHGRRPVRFLDFWRKRVARIWPAYLAALIGSLAIGVGTIDGLDGWLKHGFLLDSWFDDGGGTGLRVSWTLVVEVAFYAAVVPVGYLALAARGRRLDAWIAVCLLALAYGGWALWHTTQEHTEPWLRVLPPYLPGFALGMLLSVAEASDGRGAWLGRVLRAVRAVAGRPWLCWGLAAVLLVGMATVMEPSESAPAFGLGRDRAVQSALQVAIGALALAPLALRSARAPWLSSRPLEVMAGLSFGFFLWHIQVLRLVRPLLDESTAWATVGLGLAFAGSLVAGEVSRRLVEAPARRLILGR